MAINASNMVAVALRLLSENGQSVSVTRDIIGSYAVSTGTVTDSSDTTYTGYGYPMPYRSDQIDGTLVKQRDIQLLFRSTTKPIENDIFTIDGIVYTAQAVEIIPVKTTNIIYIVQLRQ